MVSFNATDGGIEVVDPIERRRYRLATGNGVDPTPVDGDAFYFPVDTAVSISPGTVTAAQVPDAYLRRGDGEMIAHVAPEFETLDLTGTYEVELTGPIKCYLRVDGTLTVSADDDEMTLAVEEGEVLVGARSYHERPAGTITTTDDPEDALEAVSHLGSALKTTSPERSYPTLRGHPPTIEVGEEFSVPESVEPPDTGLEIVVPPTHRAACVAAPLAFYLGAELRPGDDPLLVADGETFPLADPDWTAGATPVDATTGNLEAEPGSLEADAGTLEAGVERALKQTFLLDCVARTEGYYQVDLHERRVLDRRLGLDFDDLYGAPLAERVARMLAVPFASVADQLPRWNLAAHVEPTPDGLEALPFVVGDLGLVRAAEADRLSTEEVRSFVVNDFMDGFARSTGSGPNVDAATRDPERDDGFAVGSGMVRPESLDVVEQAWFGDGVPLGASKATPTAFQNKLDRRPDAGDIEIALVCNDDAMAAENDAVRESYGSREDLPFDVTVHRGLATAELRDVLASGADFLHYVGHIDEAGFECADGTLDARTLADVSVGTFLLNACRSYEQGVALIEAGSVGGVVTLSDVLHSGALEIGKTMARLLDLGFPLRAALSVARGQSIVGGQYGIVGDGRVSVVQEEGGLSMLCEVHRTGDPDAYDLAVEAYPPREGGMGTLASPTVVDDDRYFLAPGSLGPFRVSADELREYLERHRYPVRMDGRLAWTPDALDL